MFTKAMVLAGLLLAGISLALAGNQSFSIPPRSAEPLLPASVSNTVNLTASGNPGFNITFSLPDDYQPNSVAKIALYLTTPTVPCVARLVPFQMLRLRPGQPADAGLSGLAPQNGRATVTFAADRAVAQKTFTLQAGEELSGQNPRDAFAVGFRREADAPDDTCPGTVFVQAIDVRYTSP